MRESDGYLYKKIADTPGTYLWDNWKLLHHIAWEKVNRPVPEDHALVFRDGNRRNIAIDNLELLTRAELMSRNTIHNYPQPVKDALRALHRLERAVGIRKRKKKS